jgi:hypothetical protein
VKRPIPERREFFFDATVTRDSERGDDAPARWQAASEGSATALGAWLKALAAGLAFALGAAAANAEPAARPLPQRLSETGLFVTGSPQQTRDGVMVFSPQYPLWSDGATKRRWIQLPPGSSIDAARPDAWEFPRGVKFWKEFSVGRPVETRMIERLADGSWRYATYVWKEDGSDAVLAPPEGTASQTAKGTRYAIPSETDCRACHEGAPVPVLGFSALQLSSDRDPLAPHAEAAPKDAVDLPRLISGGWLRNLPKEIGTQPRIAASSPAERAALGYLHANCGHCHDRPGENEASVPVEAILAQKTADSAKSTWDVLRSLIGGTTRFGGEGTDASSRLVVPGLSQASLLPQRMRSRDPLRQMPPLGTNIPDEQALALIARWINHDLNTTKE